MLINFDNAKIQQLMIAFPKCDDSLRFRFSRKFLLQLKLIIRKYYIFNLLEDPIKPYRVNAFSEDTQLLLELRDLFGAVNNQLASLSSTDVKEKEQLTEEAKQCYAACVRVESRNKAPDETAPLCESVHQLIQRYLGAKTNFVSAYPVERQALNERNADSSSNEFQQLRINIPSEIKQLQNLTPDSSKSDKFPDIGLLGSVLPGQRRTLEDNLFTNSAHHKSENPNKVVKMLEDFIAWAFKDELGNPVHVVGSAYAASFYYSHLKDYETALAICRCVVESESGNLKVNFVPYFQCIFSLFFDVENMALFDENIQTVFGFINLFLKTSWNGEETRCRVVPFPDSLDSEIQLINLASRSSLTNRPSPVIKPRSKHSPGTPYVVVQVLPVEFLKYIGAQCRKRLNLEPDPKFDIIEHHEPDENRLLKNYYLLKAADSIL